MDDEAFPDPGRGESVLVDISEERRTHNEAAFREANESIRASERRLAPPLAAVPYLCECGDPRCRELVRLTAAEYEAVRAHSRRFLVVAGHDREHAVVGGGEGYAVVEKTGLPGRIAEETDPREAAS